MRSRGVSYKQFMPMLLVCVLFVWTITLLLVQHSASNTETNGENLERDMDRWSGLSLLGLADARSSSSSSMRPLVVAKGTAEDEDEVAELREQLDQMMTKQQDLQGQLDILRQQIPLLDESLGKGKPPEIGYTKWGRNYYNTRRDRPGQMPPPDVDGVVVDALPRAPAMKKELAEERPESAAMGMAGQLSSLPFREGSIKSEEDKCVLPQPLDFKKNFWQREMKQCCKDQASCSTPYSIKAGRLASACPGEAELSWDKTVVKLSEGEALPLSQLKDKQFVMMKCEDVAHIVPIPLTNEEAYNNFLRNRTKKENKMNVVVMMIDAVSRAQFIRALPNTIGLFEELDRGDKFSVFDFQFFGTLGAYSPPNRYAFFSGYPLPDNQAFFDGSPFTSSEKVLRVHERKGVWMWDVASEKGYMTYSARDMCSKTAEFVYDDFISKPWTHTHFQDIYCSNSYRSHASSSEHCFMNRYAHSYVFESGMQFFDAHDDVPRFAYLDFIEGHEPSMRVLRTMDEDLVAFMPRFLADENTIVIVASDHGIGYGSHHRTLDGPLEERLPALYVIAPNRSAGLTPDQRSQLKRNTNKLVNGVDVFETVMEVMGSAGHRPWAYSLLKPMPSRNCKEAGINVHACPCQLWDGQTVSRIAW